MPLFARYKLSVALSKYEKTPEHRQALSEAMTGRRASAATREKLSKVAKKRWQNGSIHYMHGPSS